MLFSLDSQGAGAHTRWKIQRIKQVEVRGKASVLDFKRRQFSFEL